MQALLFLVAPLQAAGLALGEPVEHAVALHLTPQGLAHLGDAVEGLVPPAIPVSGIEGSASCAEDDAQPLDYALGDFDLLLSADQVEITTSEGRLDLWIYGSLSSTPTTLVVSGDCSVLTELDETCDFQLPLTSVTAHVGIVLGLEGGPGGPGDTGDTGDTADTGGAGGAVDTSARLYAQVDDLSIDISPVTNPLDGCTLASAVGTLLGQDEDAVGHVLESQVEPQLGELAGQLEQALNDALDQLAFSTSLSLGSSALDIALFPSLLQLDERGLVLGFGLQVGGEPSGCVPAGQDEDFEEEDWPDFDGTAADSSLAYDAGLYLGRSALEHLFWAAWASGALCVDLDQLGGSPLTSGLLGPVLGEDFQALFPEDVPLGLALQPEQPPGLLFDEDDPPVAVELDGLDLALRAPLDGRDLRLFLVGMEARVGLSVELTDELLSASVDFDEDSLRFTELHDEFLPRGFSDGLADFVPTVLDMLNLDGLIPELQLPDLHGLSLGEIFWLPEPDGSWQGAFLLLDASGVEPLDVGGCQGASLGCNGSDTGDAGLDLGSLGCTDEPGGCSDGGGCSDSGGGSCNAASGRWPLWPGRLGLLLGLAGLALLRRRR